MNRNMGTLSESKGTTMPYKETLRRQMARSTRLDTFFEMKRRKSKKKTKHKLETTEEEMEDQSPRSVSDRLVSVDGRLKSQSSKYVSSEKGTPSPRSKSVTFMDERNVEPIKVRAASRKDTLEFVSECDVHNSHQRNLKVTMSEKGESSSDNVNSVNKATPKSGIQSSRDISGEPTPTLTTSSDAESDILDILEDSSEIKNNYKSSRSSIKKLSSLVKNVKPDKTDTVSECRKMFREEIMRLRQETEDFRIMCLKQIEKQKKAVEKHRKRCLLQVSEKQGESTSEWESEFTGLNESMEYLQHKQTILDKETELLNREEEIEKKQRYLEDYENEIQDVEMMLRQRQALCDRRQVSLTTLDEELNNLKLEIEENKQTMENDGIDTTPASERARQNWELTRRNMTDKLYVLENTVQKYRSELATASSTLVGKDILIQKLQEQLKENDELIKRKEKKMRNLELKLEIALSEIRHMENKMDVISSNKNNNNHLSLDKFQLVREGSQDSMILRDSSQDSGIGPRDLSPRNSQDSHNSHDSPGSRHSLRESPDSQIGSPASHRSALMLPDIPGTPMSQPGTSRIPNGSSSLRPDGSSSFRSSVDEVNTKDYQSNVLQQNLKLRLKDKIVRHGARKQSVANGNLAKLSMLKHGDDMKSGACSQM